MIDDESEDNKMSFILDIKHLRTITTAISELKKDSKASGKSSKEKKSRTLTLECYTDFIRIKDMDASKVLGISFDLDSELVTDYEHALNENETMKIVVDLDKLIEAISDIEGIVNFDVDIKNKKLLIWSSYYNYKLSFKVDKTEVKLPGVANKSSVDLTGEQLYTIFKKCSGIDRYIIITTKGTEENEDFLLTFISKEQGTNNSIAVELDEFNVLDSDSLVENSKIMIDTAVTSLVEVLKTTVKNAKVAKLLLENNRSVVITYQMIEGHGNTKILIAPRAIKV